MEAENTQFVQGDILFVKIGEFGEKEKARIGGTISKDGIVATGEKTGHKHILFGGLWEMFFGATLGSNQYGQLLFVHEDTQIRHEEHKPLDLPKGTYKIIRQQHFDYKRHAKRVVED